MAKTKLKGFAELKRLFNRLDSDVEAIIQDVLQEYMRKIYNDAMSGLPASAGSIRDSYKFEVTDGGMRVTIYTENDFAAYIEFGTGEFAKAYLAGQPEEVKAEAIQFYVNGEGKMPERAYLFPAYYKYKDEIPGAIDRRIQILFNHA